LVISGFVITLSAYKGWQEEEAARAAGQVGVRSFRRAFFVRRLARIVPLYLLTGVLYLFYVDRNLLNMTWGVQFTHYLSHLLFLHNLYPDTHGSINGPTWSIGLEMQFYLFIALVMPWMARQRIWVVGSVLLLTAWAYRYVMTLVFVPTVASPTLQVIYTSQLPGTLDEFGFGIVLALALVRGGRFVESWLVPSWRNFAIWGTAAVLLFIAAMAIFWPRSAFWYFTPMIVFWRTFVCLAVVCALAAAVTYPRQAGSLLKPFLYLGEISYGIYLWHMLVLLLMMHRYQLTGGVLLYVTLTLSCGLAALSWHAMERPIMNWARRRP
jgi:peptidoglycan/LPS O-acetylase OafA/YrhL